MARKKDRLSTTQQKVLDLAHKEIQEARESKDLNDYYIKYQARYYKNYTPEELADRWPESWELVEKWYNLHLQGIVLTHTGGPTIKKLEALGYIKILEDSTGRGSYSSDVVQVLNF